MKIDFIKNYFSHGQPPSSRVSFEKVFDVRKLKNLYCPICGSMMFTKAQCRKFCKDLSSKTGDELVSTIERYENLKSSYSSTNIPVFNSRQQEILDRIKYKAEEKKDFSLAEIADSLGCEVREKYSSFSTANILSSYCAPYPGSQPILSDVDYADVFFLKCHNKKYSSWKVAQEFIKNKYPTIEHLVPASRDGKNEFANYLCDCNECNSKRGSMPFFVWMRQLPNLEENLQIHVDQLNEALANAALSSTYSDYPQKLSQTVHLLSGGKINIEA